MASFSVVIILLPQSVKYMTGFDENGKPPYALPILVDNKIL